MSKTLSLGMTLVVVLISAIAVAAAEQNATPETVLQLRDHWMLQSSSLVKEDGKAISTDQFIPGGWQPTSVPATILTALTRNGVYPDMRVGLNAYQIPDASDEFNQEHDLAKYSHLPDKRNPWTDPYWYRTEFNLPTSIEGRRVWLNFKGINYRADVWLNGGRIADREQVVGSFSRYRLDVTGSARMGKNCLAVKIYPVDHPGVPETQLDVLGRVREYHKEIMKDVTLMYSIGYDCMPTVPDRTIGIWQDVEVETTGPVTIRDPFVVTDLPLPKTNPAYLTVSAELINATQSRQEGVLEGLIDEAGVKFQRDVELAPGETKQITFTAAKTPQLVLKNPRLWWPRNYGPQNLYKMSLVFRVGKEVSDCRQVTFGVRKITKELYELDGAHGLRIHINGQRIFGRGGYIQPEVMHDWDADRMDKEVRYLTEANLNLTYFEDVSNPPDEFLDACDKYGLMFGECFYGCYWMTPGSGNPTDLDLLERSTVDIIKRYRNHPSLVLYMAMNEGDTREDVYEMWRKHILDLDGTRLHIPSGSFPDYRKNVPRWIKKDTPVGMNDYDPKSYGWQEPAQYFRWVRESRDWMFKIESGSASLPPVDSLRRFIPDLWETPAGPLFPLTPTWAHHGANSYYKPYDEALRRLHGKPTSVEDYCMKGHLVTADQNRAMFEAVNHRMWDITSGFTQWKVNACWPTVQWHIYDWYLKPMVSYYYIKNACAPLHVQLCPLDNTVAVINNNLELTNDLEVCAKVFDFDMKLRWKATGKANLAANSCKDVLTIPDIPDLTPVYFVKLEVKQADGRLVSENFYWLPSGGADFTSLAGLPRVKLDVSRKIGKQEGQNVLSVKVTNSTDKLAFFTHLAVTDGTGGEEVLPVLWDDNYFSLLPGESKTVRARLDDRVDASKLALEVGGWNIESGYECSDLKLSKTQAEVNEPLVVKATIKNTFIDGSPIDLYLDDEVIDSQRFWARGETVRELTFDVKSGRPGRHRLRVGDKTVEIVVE